MMRLLSRFFLFVLFLSLVLPARAAVDPAVYGVPVPAASIADQGAAHLMDSLLNAHPQLSSKIVVSAIKHPHLVTDRTMDFYLLLFLCFMLGLIRLSDPKYFHGIWSAFWNPSPGSRLLRERLQGAALSNMLMNLFFTVVAGAYIYYVVKVFGPQRTSMFPPSLLVILLIAGVMIIYLAKYAVIKFSGWAFRVEGVTDYYIFNVFLINKIIAITVLPFIILIAFVGAAWAQPIVIVSLAVVGILLINRYVRSWQVFGSFFQYSKFHFFTYLCASELLPLAVLMKLMVRGLMFY